MKKGSSCSALTSSQPTAALLNGREGWLGEESKSADLFQSCFCFGKRKKGYSAQVQIKKVLKKF